jgi:drug/metabolite transporter (DMT)-like permease
MVSLLGPARAAVFPALAPGIAALLAWPVLDHKPSDLEWLGLAVSIGGLIWTVTGSPAKVTPMPVKPNHLSQRSYS